jgi:hypothetical protein
MDSGGRGGAPGPVTGFPPSVRSRPAVGTKLPRKALDTNECAICTTIELAS